MKTALLIAGAGAMGAVVLLDRAATDCNAARQRDGRHAGVANTAAAADMRRRLAASAYSALRFDVPVSASMLCAWSSMRALIGKRQALSLGELVAVCDLWLNAYDAGYAASGSVGLTGSLYPEARTNYSTVALPLPPVGRPYSHGDGTCAADYDQVRTELGEKLCALITWRDGMRHRLAFGVVAPNDQAEMLARTKACALAMDAVDFVPEGKRPYDKHDASLGEAIGGLIRDVFKGVFSISPATLAVLAIGAGGFIAWRTLR